MQNFRDYYETLGVAKTASADEIKRSYRRLAREYHPDVNPGDKAAEEKFKLLGEAYGVLSDSDKRTQYDQYSSYWQAQSSGSNKGWGKWTRGKQSTGTDYSAFEDFDNFVEQLLKEHQTDTQGAGWTRGGQRSSQAQTARQGTQTNQTTTTRTAERNGANRDYSERTTPTAATEQTTARSSYRRQPAPPSRRDAEADLVVPLEKAYAGGRERVRLEDGRSLEVNMPPGMITGQRIRLKGQGIDGGNLYLRIEVEPHSYFTVQDGDVYCALPLTPSEAVLGGTISMPTLAGSVTMMVPPGVQTGQRLKLTGKGYPIGEGLYGDQIVEISVVMPERLDDEEKALYQELKRIERFNPRAGLPF